LHRTHHHKLQRSWLCFFVCFFDFFLLKIFGSALKVHLQASDGLVPHAPLLPSSSAFCSPVGSVSCMT
jgi:hypothetical protein